MFKRSRNFCLKHFMCGIGYYSSLSSAMNTNIAIVFLQLLITTRGEFDLACDPVNPSAQTDVTCVCRRTVGSGIKWYFNGNSISDCFLNSGCLPQPIGHTFSINVSEFAYEMTKSAYDYNDCTQINCTDASNTNVQLMVVPSAIKFDPLNPTPISEPAQSHNNGSISITTGCISGYMDVTCEWYTVYNGKPEKYTYGQSAFDTYENSSCSNCNADVNAKKTCGFNHIEASGNETKNVNFRVVLTHTPTNLTWELNSANVYTVKGINESSVSSNVTSIPHTTPTSAYKSKATTSEKYGIPSSISSISVLRNSTIVTTVSEKYQNGVQYAAFLYIGLACFVVISIVVIICYVCCYRTMNKRKTNKNESYQNDPRNFTDTSKTSHL